MLFGYDGVKGVLFAIVSRSMSEPCNRAHHIDHTQ